MHAFLRSHYRVAEDKSAVTLRVGTEFLSKTRLYRCGPQAVLSTTIPSLSHYLGSKEGGGTGHYVRSEPLIGILRGLRRYERANGFSSYLCSRATRETLCRQPCPVGLEILSCSAIPTARRKRPGYRDVELMMYGHGAHPWPFIGKPH